MAFFRAEIENGAEVLIPRPRARSGWGSGGPGQIRGTAASGALARASERAAAQWDDAGRFRPVRWTVDLFRPAPMEPVSTETTVVRRGRRLRLIDTVLLHDDVVVARASALLLATDSPPAAGAVWNSDAEHDRADLPPVPDLRPATSEQTLYFSGPVGWTGDAAPHRNGARKATFHLPEAVVEHEEPSAFQRVATVADSSNLAGNWGSHGIEFINADLTLTLARLPDGDGGIGILAEGRHESDGIALARTSLFDRTGRLGTVMMSSLANSGSAVDPGSAGM